MGAEKRKIKIGNVLRFDALNRLIYIEQNMSETIITKQES